MTQESSPTPDFSEDSIAIIGAGQMGEAMADGFVEDGKTTKSKITICVRRESRVQYFKSKGYENTTTDLSKAAMNCKTLFLCAKPLDIPQILLSIRPYLREEQLVVSIAAGITLDIIENNINKSIGVIRVMPNNCCIVKASATVYCLGKFATEAQALYLENLLTAMGIVSRTQEKLMDTFTGFTGSGPAYAYLFIQSLADGAVRNGVPREQALKFAAQILYGSGKLVLESKKHPANLIDSVMTPAGTTAEGLLVLEKSAFRAHVVKAVTEATKRSQELGKGLGEIKYLYKEKRKGELTDKIKKDFCGIKRWDMNWGFYVINGVKKVGKILKF